MRKVNNPEGLISTSEIYSANKKTINFGCVNLREALGL